MSKYPLGRILGVRELREDQAARELRRRQDALEAAVAVWEAREAEAQEGARDLRRREDEAAEAAVGKRIETGIARSQRREIEAWRGRQEEVEAMAESARKAVDAARAAWGEARARYQARMKDKHKLMNHREAWQIQAGKEAEAAEEKELEEAARGGAVGKAAEGAGEAE
jgi:hypothetical protein